MKTYKYLLAGICSMFMFTSCLEDFQKLNTDPEQMGSADPRAVFTGATQNYNNCSRYHLTSLYGGSMTYMQYLVSDGGASAGSYIKMSTNNVRTEPGNPAYSYYYSTFGLRLDYLINTVIPGNAEAERNR